MHIFNRRNIQFCIYNRGSSLFKEKKRVLGFGKRFIQEFIGFLRPKICLFITGIAISGFLLFNPLSYQILYVALGTFFVSAASYSYNLITDKDEDLINHKKVNWFVTNNSGSYLVLCFLTLGFISVLFLSSVSIIFFISAAVSGAIYSYFRVKNIFPIKNLYTGLSLSIAFMIGATNAPVIREMLVYIPSLFMLLFVTSLISDLRDYQGDRMTGIRTFPVILGYEITKKILFVILIIFTTSIFVLKLHGLYTLLLFVLPISILIYQNKQKVAHLITMLSFVCLPGGIYLMRVIS